MYCSNCGKNNPEGSKFCQHCGIKLSENRTINTSSEEKKSSHVGTWIVCIIAVIVVGFFVLAIIGSSSNSSSNSNSSTINTSATSTDSNTTPTQAPANGWISYTPDSGQFTVSLPSYPLHKVETADSGDKYDNYTTSTDNGNTGYYVDVYSVSPTNDVDTFLETTLNNMLQGIGKGSQVTYRNYSNVGSYRALDYVIAYSYNKTTIAGRVLLDTKHNTMYALLDAYYNSTPDTNGLKEFLSSFQIN